MNSQTALDSIALSHGQARWLFAEGLHLSDTPDSAFDSYLKFLRRGGVPFGSGETPGGPGINVVYRYHHLMEVVLALALHRQAILKGDVVGLLVEMREELRPLFRRAWLERASGLGASVPVKVGAGKGFRASGLWLDLGLHYIPGGPLATTGPKLLGPEEAIKFACTLYRQQHYRDPIRISDYADDVVRLAPEAPEVRRGRQ
jgi:hypothetical protein